LRDQFPGFEPGPRDPNDPAWQPPGDALDGVNMSEVARLISREIPNSAIQSGWTPAAIRMALVSLVSGIFDLPAQLIDSIIGDSRVQASLASLSGGLFSRPIRFDVPKRFKGDARAQDCLDAWRELWPTIGAEGTLSEFMQWDAMLGFAIGQITWDTSDPKMWIPHLLPWHPRYSYYHWMYRRYIAITLDGPEVIEPGGGHWVLHSPHNPYRGWMRGSVRAIAPWWLSRNYALRDFSRYSERHGMPVLKAITPFGADPKAIAAFRLDVSRMGQESTMQLPQSADPKFGKYDLDLLEASDQGWEGFLALIQQCNNEIVLPLQGQNLTTEVKEGSLAAARVHGDVRQSIIESKARGFQRTWNQQLARPFAALNFGDAELAPLMSWDIEPYEDRKEAAQTLLDFAQALNYFRFAGKKVNDPVALARAFGLKIKAGDLTDVAPLQVEAKEAGATGKADTEEASGSTEPKDDAPPDDSPERATPAGEKKKKKGKP
jgi:phage gp29-like protein